MDKILFIAQARSGSTRMPGKILLPFYDGKTIIEIIIERLKEVEGADVMVATTDNERDDQLAQLAAKRGAMVYRGSESDVLGRFIEGARSAGYSRIIRVCSDNPFLDPASLAQLVKAAQANPEADYISFDINGTPSIKTHYGFWTEYVSLAALERVAASTSDPLWHEHVTNYIYSHPGEFRIEWLEGPGELLRDKPIRLTIDTPADFANAAEIYGELMAAGQPLSIEGVVEAVSRRPAMLSAMRQEIIKNTK